MNNAIRLEWLETNGLGGYASSTISGANTRRYHGLLVPAVKPPLGRFVLLSKLDERLNGVDLATNIYPGAVNPRGFEHLHAFERDIFPVFKFGSLTKTIAAIHGENTTVILYESTAPATLELRPFIAGRDYHHLVAANDAIRRDFVFDNGVFTFSPYDGVPTLHLLVPRSTFAAAPDWYYRFEYPVELERGLDFHEDLFTPGVFTVTIGPDTPLAVIASTEHPRGRDGRALLVREERRRERAIARSPAIGRRLALAADQFIVRRGAERRTIIAGYHWFTDWGRDTMISLAGLCLATHRHDDARLILLEFCDNISQGMVPNRFPDEGEEPEYNSVDASLWIFVAMKKYVDATGDRTLVSGLRDIIRWFERGTRYNIHQDDDGLLMAGAPGIQLTWMDVRIGDRLVTPRHGKPVEINALWYNALMILAELEGDAALRTKAERVRARFREVFWNAQTGCLDDVAGDPTIRPNQIFALSLPYPLIEGEEAHSILRVIEERLLTPFGLRTLDPNDPRFHPTATGTVAERDEAYHQGTVWPWLLGPYITAIARVRGDAGVEEGRHALRLLEANLDDACVGSISEILDAVAPFTPRGCVAQAWSVGEMCRVLVEDLK